MSALVAPFPYFGGKRRVAAEVWARFGDVRSYVEPFFGSGAVLLARPRPFRGVETVNDLDGLLCNFWRAVKAAPQEVATHADWPVSECDLTARHLWLVERRASITERLCADPDWFDAQAAGWWVWGASHWVGSGWGFSQARQIPSLPVGRAGGTGISAWTAPPIPEWMDALSGRLRGVRVICGGWDRLNGIAERGASDGWCTGVFLDPPYESGEMNYGAGGMGCGLAADVRAWAVKAGERPDMRIALCGYDEHDELASAGWTLHRWKARGGYGNQGGDDADDNRHRECVWFSPACLGAKQPSLFGEAV